MPTTDCRISKLEANHDNFIEEFREHCRYEENESRERRRLLEEVRDAQKDMRGFVKGIAFTVTAIASVAGFVVNKLWGQ